MTVITNSYWHWATDNLTFGPVGPHRDIKGAAGRIKLSLCRTTITVSSVLTFGQWGHPIQGLGSYGGAEEMEPCIPLRSAQGPEMNNGCPVELAGCNLRDSSTTRTIETIAQLTENGISFAAASHFNHPIQIYPLLYGLYHL